MTRLRKATILALALGAAAAAPWAILFGVNAMMGEAPAAYAPGRCTRSCHDRGCRHSPALPPLLTSDQGLFGLTVRALHGAGSRSGLGPRRGYGAVNILLFCLVWPAAMLALLGVALWQRLELRDRRRRDG